MGGLFQLGEFRLRSGGASRYRIECDALTPGDWECLAAMAAELVPPFREVRGVPRGGLPFAAALAAHADPLADVLLIAEDVVTTGGSMERFLAATPVAGFWAVAGVAAFARSTPPDWVRAVFRCTPPPGPPSATQGGESPAAPRSDRDRDE